MAETEHRTYQVTGELIPEQWDLLLRQLGGAGLTAAQVSVAEQTDASRTGAAEDTSQEANEALPPGPIANRSDFRAYAQEIDATPAVAGRAWGTLTRLYDHKVNEAYHRQVKGQFYDLYRYRQHSPLVFRRVPPFYTEGGLSPSGWHRRLRDLDVMSLERQLQVVDTAIGELGGAVGIREALGREVGEKTFAFLYGFVAHSLRQWEAQQTPDET